MEVMIDDTKKAFLEYTEKLKKRKHFLPKNEPEFKNIEEIKEYYKKHGLPSGDTLIKIGGPFDSDPEKDLEDTDEYIQDKIKFFENESVKEVKPKNINKTLDFKALEEAHNNMYTSYMQKFKDVPLQVVSNDNNTKIVGNIGTETFEEMLDLNEGVKDQNGKIDYSEVDFDILDLMANRFSANKHKYPHGNMLKPIEEKSLLFAMFRHWKKLIKPIDGDPETFEDHVTAIFCNGQMLLQQRKLKK